MDHENFAWRLVPVGTAGHLNIWEYSAHQLGGIPLPDAFVAQRPLIDPDLSVAAYRGDDLIGCAFVRPLELHVDGRMIRCAGITGVAVAPSWRGRGLWRAMRQVLERTCAQAGFNIGGLWSADFLGEKGRWITTGTRTIWTVNVARTARFPRGGAALCRLDVDAAHAAHSVLLASGMAGTGRSFDSWCDTVASYRGPADIVGVCEGNTVRGSCIFLPRGGSGTSEAYVHSIACVDERWSACLIHLLLREVETETLLVDRTYPSGRPGIAAQELAIENVNHRASFQTTALGSESSALRTDENRRQACGMEGVVAPDYF